MKGIPSYRLTALLASATLGLLLPACSQAPPPAEATEAAAPKDDGWYPHEGGELRYRVQIRFGEELANKKVSGAMPEDWEFARVSAVDTDAEGNVYVFQRGARADPIVVFDREGTKMIRSWGKGFFTKPHGLRLDSEGNVWLTDTGDHAS